MNLLTKNELKMIVGGGPGDTDTLEPGGGSCGCHAFSTIMANCNTMVPGLVVLQDMSMHQVNIAVAMTAQLELFAN